MDCCRELKVVGICWAGGLHKASVMLLLVRITEAQVHSAWAALSQATHSLPSSVWRSGERR